MSFCDHCQGQRFDRAQVLRALRAARQRRLRESRTQCDADQTLALAIETVRALDIPQSRSSSEDVVNGEVVH